jgi:hypothetical protein
VRFRSAAEAAHDALEARSFGLAEHADGDDAESLASFYGLARLAGIAPDPASRCEEILSVTREQVRDVAGQIFRPERLAAVAVGVLGKTERTRLERVVRGFGS